jgi:hypothetical protein
MSWNYYTSNLNGLAYEDGSVRTTANDGVAGVRGLELANVALTRRGLHRSLPGVREKSQVRKCSGKPRSSAKVSKNRHFRVRASHPSHAVGSSGARGCLSSLLHRPRMLLHARGYQEASARDHLVLGVAVSDANTFFTSDWDTPNCRAICDGLIPALSAARTALTCPRVNETFATSACCLSLDDDCFATGSSVGFGSALGGNLPRRFASSTDAVMSRSSSVSLR